MVPDDSVLSPEGGNPVVRHRDGAEGLERAVGDAAEFEIYASHTTASRRPILGGTRQT